MAETQYTQSERNILHHLGFSDKLIDSGYQTRGMSALLAAVNDTLAWLNARYPGEEITLLKSLDGGSVNTTLHFSAMAGDTAFDVYRYGRTGEVRYEETLWGIRHQAELDPFVSAHLAQAGYPDVIPTMRLDDRMGDQYAVDAKLGDVLASGETCFVLGHLYVPEAQYDEALCQELNDVLVQAGLRGLVSVCAYDQEFDLQKADSKMPVNSLGLTAHCLISLNTEGK